MKIASGNREGFWFFHFERASAVPENPLLRFLLCALVIVILFFLCMGTIILASFIVLHPEAPRCDLEDLQITSFHFFNTTSADSLQVLNADLLVKITVYNRIEKQGLWYGPTAILAFLDEQLGGKNLLEQFYQDPQQTRQLQAIIQAREVPVTEEMQAKLHQEDAAGNRSMDVGTEIHVGAKLRILSWVSYHFKVQLQCTASVRLPTRQNGSTMLSKSCEVKRQAILCGSG